jgi:hypothetical protein
MILIQKKLNSGSNNLSSDLKLEQTRPSLINLGIVPQRGSFSAHATFIGNFAKCCETSGFGEKITFENCINCIESRRWVASKLACDCDKIL